MLSANPDCWQLLPAAQGYTLQTPAGSARCLVGAGGLVDAQSKREGDGATPVGSWQLRALYYRADRLAAPGSGLPEYPLTPESGWCDDAGDKHYNRFVTLSPGLPPSQTRTAGAERLYREDSSYDILLTLSHNQDPVVAGKGSAIFVHCIARGQTETAGCLAIERELLHRFARSAGPATRLIIPAPASAGAAV